MRIGLVVRAVLGALSRQRKGTRYAALCGGSSSVAGVAGRIATIGRHQLAAAAREVQDVFAAKTDADVRQARQQLDQAVAGLDRLMARWDNETRTDWQDYLDWQPVKEQLATENPDRDKLRTVLGKFYANHEGFETPQFIAFREALQAYVNVSDVRRERERARSFTKGFADELAERLEAYQQQPNTDDAVRIGQIVGWMARYGQATELTEAVRHHLARPNLFVQFSEDMMRTGIETDIEEQRAFVRTSWERIRGNATMKGRLSIDLIPSENSAAIDLLLTGTTYSNNTGYNGPVTIFSTGVTSVDARKRVLIDAEGISVQRPEPRAGPAAGSIAFRPNRR
jgi:hypothetical protein